MANLLGKTLLSLAAACIVPVAAAAQESDDLREAVHLLRTNQRDAALEKLREVLQSDPDNEAAFRLAEQVDAQNWQLLLAEGGEFEKIARSLLSRAKLGRAERSRDEAQISDRVARALQEDYGTRRQAVSEILAEHGEFAVPAFVAILGDENRADEQTYAISALNQIGRTAALPLIAALQSDNELQRRNVAAALSLIGDRRAVPAFLALASNDPSAAVRDIATRALERFGVAQGTSAAEAYVEDAKAYLFGGRSAPAASVVWSWQDGQLVATDVPPALYDLELGKRAALDAARLEPQNDAAKALLATAYLAQSAVIGETLALDPENEAMAPLGDKVGRLSMVAMAMGRDVLRRSLGYSLAANRSTVAVYTIQALAQAEDKESIGRSPLVAALDNPDSRVRYAAALALSRTQGPLPASDRVVQVLAEAIGEEAIRQILFIDGNPLRRGVATAAGRTRGVAVNAAASGLEGVSDFVSFPNYDVVVVAEVLPNRLPEDVISLIRQYSDRAKIVLLAETEEAEERYGERVDGILSVAEGELTEEQLLAKINEVVDEMDARRARADTVAIAAGEALARLAEADIPVSGAVDSLVEQLDRDEAVAISAARALGDAGGLDQAAALAQVVAGSGSEEFRVTAAQSIGRILARSTSVPSELFEQLVAIATDEAKELPVRNAVVTALGKGPLAPGERVRLADMLTLVAANGGEDL